jgi:GNAT superfamily N-acetyltransferase
MSDENRLTVRTTLKPGDIGAIVRMHGLIYAKEYGFDHTFEAYVAGPLAECVRAAFPRDCIWIAEKGERIVGCIAIVAASPNVAQLRWFLVDPAVRGCGLGKRLLNESLAFCKGVGYKSIILWTVSSLTSAGQLYRSVGFEKVEEKPGRCWGVDVIEEKYKLLLET